MPPIPTKRPKSTNQGSPPTLHCRAGLTTHPSLGSTLHSPTVAVVCSGNSGTIDMLKDLFCSCLWPGSSCGEALQLRVKMWLLQRRKSTVCVVVTGAQHARAVFSACHRSHVSPFVIRAALSISHCAATILTNAVQPSCLASKRRTALNQRPAKSSRPWMVISSTPS
jgi:phage gp46-like protein